MNIHAWVMAKKESIIEAWETFSLFMQKYFWPFLKILMPLWGWLAARYKCFYIRLAYKDGVHDKVKGARAIAILSVCTVLSFYVSVWHIVPPVARFVFDATAIASSYEVKGSYFSKPEWVADEDGKSDDVLMTMGCSAKPCSEENATTYKFRDSSYLSLTYLLKGSEYDYVENAGIMQEELNYCDVKAYGWRVKILGWYPYIYKITCYDLPK